MARKIIFEPSHSLKEFRLLTGKTTLSNVMGKISLKTRFCRSGEGFVNLNIPLVSAAMQAVTGKELAVALAQLGGIGVVPCSIPLDEQARIVRHVKRFKAGFQENVICVSKDDKVSKVMKVMKEKGYGKFPVTAGGKSNGKLLGIITGKNFDPKRHADDKVSKHMVDAVMAKEGISLGDADRKMIEHGTDVLPIVDKKDSLKFVVFKKDVEKHLSFPEGAVDENKRYLVAGAVSTQPADKKRIDALFNAGVDVIAVDASDGYSQFQADTLQYIKKKNKDMPVIGGNVINQEGFEFLANAGFDGVKVGMGIGSGCTTQAQKGTGRGQATALIEVCQARDEFYNKKGIYLPVISDGSIANSGQMMIALALGADSVMMGRFFAQFTESAGGLRKHPTMGPLKEYWMEASARARSYGRYDTSVDTFFEEGVEGFVPHLGSIYMHLRETVLKMKSSLSSAGCRDITEMHDKVIVELQSESALIDAGVHDIITK